MSPSRPSHERVAAFAISAFAVLVTQLSAAGETGALSVAALSAIARCALAGAVSHPLLRLPASVRVGVAVLWGAAELFASIWPGLRGGAAEPFEGTLMAALSGTALCLAAGGVRARLAGGVAFGVCLLGSMGAGAAIRPWLIVVACGSGVLMLTAFESSRSGRRGFPWAASAALSGAVMATCAGVQRLLPSSELRTSAAGWVASSGGGGSSSEAARRGVGDGAEQVHGSRDPRSAGFDVGDTFVNSDDPGLYDAFVESFGQPSSSRGNPKMIGLKQRDIRLSSAQVGLDFRNGRPLELRRDGPVAGDAPRLPRADDTMLWVTPPEPDRPCHVPLAIYDRWDGDRWLAAPLPQHNAALTPRDFWMTFVDAPASRLLGPSEHWEVRVGRATLDVVPLPGATASFRVGLVNRADFFTGGGEGLVRLFNRTVPPGTVVEAVARCVAPGALGEVAPARRGGPAAAAAAGVAGAVAAEWCEGLAPGWGEVTGIVDRLRRHGAYDRAATAQADGGVENLLVGTRRGSALQFASAAALMLGSRGYDVRLVAGMYADPARLDAKTGAIPVRLTDAHAWVEVRAADGTWVMFEPTPGFRAERAVRPTDRLAAWASAARPHLVWSASALAVLVGCVLARGRIADCLLSLRFRWRARRVRTELQARRLGLMAVQLIEMRAARARAARRGGESPALFLRRLGVPPEHVAPLERALYSPPGGGDRWRTQPLAVASACLEVERLASLRCLLKLRRKNPKP